VGRLKKSIANTTALILFLSAGYGAWDYAGNIAGKSEKPPAIVQQMSGNEILTCTPSLQTEPQNQEINVSDQAQTNGKCIAVHDGDTITVRLDASPQKLTNIRLIGVDTPELVRGEFGETVGNFTRSLLQGQRVKLVCDKEKYDKYGRMLAYVYLEDGTFVNAKLLEEGYARVMSIKPNITYASEFQSLQDEAQKEQCGI